MDFNAMHKQRKFILITAAVGFISMFLSWSKYGHVNGLRGEGMLIFFGFIAAGVLSWLGDQKKPLAKNPWLGTMGACAVILLMWLIILLQALSNIGDLFKYAGIGFWICLLASAALVYFAYNFRDPSLNLKSSLNDMKNKMDNNPNT